MKIKTPTKIKTKIGYKCEYCGQYIKLGDIVIPDAISIQKLNKIYFFHITCYLKWLFKKGGRHG